MTVEMSHVCKSRRGRGEGDGGGADCACPCSLPALIGLGAGASPHSQPPDPRCQTGAHRSPLLLLLPLSGSELTF